MRKRRKTSLICALALLLCLAACNGPAASSQNSSVSVTSFSSGSDAVSASVSGIESSDSAESDSQSSRESAASSAPSALSEPDSSAAQPAQSSQPPSSQHNSSVISSSGASDSEESSMASSAISSQNSSVAASSKASSAAASSKTSSVSSVKTSSAASSKASSAASSQAVSSDPAEKTYSKSVPRKLATVRGEEVYTDGHSKVDASNKAEGYLLVTCSDPAASSPICQIVKGDDTYNYNMDTSREWIFPLNSGGGSYSISIYTKVEGNYYGLLYSCTVTVALRNPLMPFLYNNSYVDYVGSSRVISLAEQLTADCMSDLEQVRVVFDYVTSTLTYNTKLAEQITGGSVTVYSPNLDSILNTKKGICYDYAALMTAMLRSRNIPCKLVTGYVGSAFHAWVSVYVDDVGWIDNYVHFEGGSWQLMDPTFVSSGGSKVAASYIGDGKNYRVADEY